MKGNIFVQHAQMIGDSSKDVYGRGIIIKKKSSELERIYESYSCYMPLQYPLQFPYGVEGWRHGIVNRKAVVMVVKQKRVSIREFYAFRLQYREHGQSIFFQSGRLFQ